MTHTSRTDELAQIAAALDDRPAPGVPSALASPVLGFTPAELGSWLARLRPSEMTRLLADLALHGPESFDASRRRVASREL